MGVPYLSVKLNQMLLGHIRACLPELRTKAASALVRARGEIAKYGHALLTLTLLLTRTLTTPTPTLATILATIPAPTLAPALTLTRYGDALLEGKSNQGALMLQLITQFANNYCDAIDGTSAQVLTLTPTLTLTLTRYDPNPLP